MFTEGDLAHENRPIRFHYPVKKNKSGECTFFSLGIAQEKNV